MSEVVDSNLPQDEHVAFLEEIRNELPAFLSASATERVDALGDVSELLNLRQSDLRKVIAVHFALSESVIAFVDGLRDGLNSPLTGSVRPRISSQGVRGPIDWSATIGRRAANGWNSSTYVVRPAQRVFDIPENRAMVWLLERLDIELRQVAPARQDSLTGVHSEGWMSKISHMRSQIRSARLHHWVRGIRPERPDPGTVQALLASRSRLYKVHMPNVLTALRTYVEREPSAKDVTELICQRYFEPERQWKLFELVVCLRLAKEFADHSDHRRKSRLLLGTGRSPYARYLLDNGDEVWLWYQVWPKDSEASTLLDALQHYAVHSSGSRPDIVVQLRRNGETVRTLLLEVKASRVPGTLGAGLLQLLGYLKDRPELFEIPNSAWLVAPPSDSFASVAADGRDLWMVDSDCVARAASAALAPT